MRYDNKAFCDALNDQGQTVSMAEVFLAKMGHVVEPTDDHAIDELYREAASAHVKRQIGIIWSTAESPIERILMSSLLMNFLRNDDPFGLVLTRAMADTPRDVGDLRDGIRELKAAIETRQREGGKMSPDALIHDLDAARQSKRVDEWQYDLNLHMLWCYHFFGLETALHLTPQATFPGLTADGRAARADMLCWIPAYSDFEVIVECDSYMYHENRQAFDHDRQRSRAFQRKGYKVLQYSGGEIRRDPIRSSSELYDHLTEAVAEFARSG
jgi:hypothetical protein